MGEKTGLVLEGGGTRGLYTAGILDEFLKNDIKFDGVIGASAGALFGVNFVSGQRGRAIRYNKRFNKDKNYMGLLPLLKEGNIVSTDFAYNRVPKELDPFDNDSFMKSKVPFYAVATNVETGNPEYFHIDDVFSQMDILRASGSLPIVSKPVKINNNLYLDGGITDSIPFQWMLNNGYSKVVVILTRHQDYRKKPMSKALIKILSHGKYPVIAKKLAERYKMYNRQLDSISKLQSEGIVYAIRPSEKTSISKLERDESKLQQIYDLGANDCRKEITSLKAFLNNSYL